MKAKKIKKGLNAILWIAMLFLYVLFYQCKDNSLEPDEESTKPETESHTPKIDISTNSIDFGEVWVGKDSILSFSVFNTGDTVLNVESVSLQSDIFSVASPEFPQKIDTEDNIVVTIEFLPEEKKSYSDNLTIVSDDPDESEATISLKGVGIGFQPGGMKWRCAINREDYSLSVPAIGTNGVIYLSGHPIFINTNLRDSLYAINPDGTVHWRNGFEYGSIGPGEIAVGEDGTIYVIKRFNLFAINPDGTEKWKFPIEGSSKSIAIGADNLIYVGAGITMTYETRDDYLYAINPNGTLKWKSNPGGKLAIGTDGTIYVSAWQSGHLYAFNNKDGSIKWEFERGWNQFLHENEARFTSPVIDADGTIYVASIADENRNLYAVNSDGTEKWSYWLGPRLLSPPIIGMEGIIYIGSDFHYFYAINPDGTGKWRADEYNLMSKTPAIGGNGTIYIAADSYLYALNSNGTERWSFRPSADLEGDYRYPQISTSPVIGEDGTIYLIVTHTESAWPNRQHNYLYAIQGKTGLANSPWPMYKHDPQHTGRQE